MKKHFLKSFALLAMLFSALTLSAQSGVDWSTYEFLGDGAGGGAYSNKYKVSAATNLNIVNIQKPGWSTEAGIYVHFSNIGAITTCDLPGYSVDGGGMVMHLSSFIAKETQVNVTCAAGSCTFWVYYADGTTGGSSEPVVVESNYCQKLLTNGDKEIYVTAIKTAENVYQLIVEGEKVSQITGTHYNPGGIHIGGLTPKEKTTGDYGNKVVYEFELESAPTIYNALYVLFEGSGDLSFGNINDIVWGTCPEKETSILTSLNATAANTLCKVNESVAITVVAKDQYGANMNAGTVEYTISPADAGTIVDNVFTPTKAGLVTITASVGTVQAEPVEVYAYAGDNLALSTNIVTDNKIIAQSDINPTINDTKAFFAVDGNEGSVWQGSYTNGTADNDVARTYDAWFVVDLGAYYDLDLVSIHFEGACSQAYTIAVSKDFVNWVTAYTYNGSAGVQQNRIDALYGTNLQNAQKVRFVRFWSTKAATGYGMKIWEMQVYGSNRQEVTKSVTKPVINSATVTSKTIEQAILSINTTSSVAIAKYRVVDNANGIDWFVSSLNPTEYVIAHLKDNTSYTLSLYAYDIDGNISDVFTMEEFKTLADNTKPTTASPTPTRDEEDVLAFYSDTYTPVINWGSKKDWNGAGTVTENAISANNYLMYKDVTWWGWTYGVKDGYTDGTHTGVNCSDMEYLHIDIWSDVAGSIWLKPIYGGTGLDNNENYYAVVEFEANKWNSVDIAIEDFQGSGDKHDFSSIYQLKFDQLSPNTATVSIDNVYFWKSAGTAPVESVTLDKTTATIEIEEALQLNATVLPMEAGNKNIIWTSSNETVATVSAEGIVTGLTVGTTTITATSEANGEIKATCEITVEPITAKTWWGEPTTIKIEGVDVAILYSYTRNENKTITYSVIFDNPASAKRADINVNVADVYNLMQDDGTDNNTAIWTSTTTHSKGETITGFWYIAGNRIDFTYIVGSSNERPNTAVTSVTLDKTSCDLLVDETVQLLATVNPGIAANKNVTWTSSNTAVATVDANGLVTAKSAGTATITVTTAAGGKTATCTVNVVAALTDAIYHANAYFVENGRYVGVNYTITRTPERKLRYEVKVNAGVVGLVMQVNDGDYRTMIYDAVTNSYTYTSEQTYTDGATISGFFYPQFAGGANRWDFTNYVVGSTNTAPRTMVGINDQEADQTTRLAQYTSPVDVVLARAITPDDDWFTISLPFALNATQITEIFGDGTQVLKLAKAGVAPDQVTELGFSPVNAIQAATPYLIKPTKKVNAGTVLRNITLATTSNPVKVSNVTMHPLLNQIEYDYTNDAVLFFLGTDNLLYYQATDNKLLGLRAYFTFDGATTYSQAAQVRARVVFNENETTDLDNLITTDAPVKVIENGQLIIIRDGVKYNIQGQKL